MGDWSISITKALASICWLVGLGLAVTAIFVPATLGPLGVSLCAAGGTLTARHWFMGLHCRELNAFKLGQEASSVRPVR